MARDFHMSVCLSGEGRQGRRPEGLGQIYQMRKLERPRKYDWKIFWIPCQLRINKEQRWNSLTFGSFFLLQDQSAKGERINKETGELSASGELSVSVELKVDKVEGSCKNPQLPQELREQLQELGLHTCSSPDHKTEHVPLEQREEQLVKVLPLYIQVWGISYFCSEWSECFFFWVEGWPWWRSHAKSSTQSTKMLLKFWTH